MLTTRIMTSSQPVANQLVERGVHLSTLDGSPLAELVRANISASVLADAKTSESAIDVDRLHNDSQRVGVSGEREHDATMSELVTLVGERINALMHLTRNEVVPTVKTLLEKYHRHMDDLSIEVRSPATVVPNVYHGLWSLPQWQGMVERYSEAPMNDRQMDITLPRLTESELAPMLKTGLDSLDGVIEDWLDTLPEGKALEVYNRLFVAREVPVGRAIGPTHITADTNLDRNDHALAFLILSGFEEHMPNGVNIPLDQLRASIAQMKEQLGRVLALELKRRETDYRRNVLVYAVDKHSWKYTTDGRTVILVNNDVYLKFLEAGGSVEAICGAVSGEHTRDYQSILDDKDRYEKTWTRRLNLHRQRIAANIYAQQREALRVTFSRYINEQKDNGLPSSPDVLHSTVSTLLGDVTQKDLEDEVRVVQDLVCDVFYSNSNAKQVLAAMDVTEKENPEMNPRECALYATIDLMARWLASQIQIHRN